MRLSVVHCCRVVSALLVFGPGWHTALPADEFQQRSVWNIHFEGAEEFDSDQLQTALALDHVVQQLSDPLFELTAFDQAVCERLTDGYRFRGYHEATVTAARDENRILQVQLQEGPRYRLADIEVNVDDETRINVEKLRIGLTTKSAAELDKKIDTSDEKVWSSGEYASFATEVDDRYLRRVQRLLQLQGFHFAKVDVQLQPHAADRSADLQINISDAGQQQPVKAIRFEGLTRHTEAEVLQYLELPDQLVAGQALEQTIEQRLLNSGRFVHVTAISETPFASDHAVAVDVTLEEYDHVPKLSEPLTADQQVLADLSAWFRKLPSTDTDLNLTVTLSGKEKMINQVAQHYSQNLLSVPETLQPQQLAVDLLLAGRGGGIAQLTASRDSEPLIDVTAIALETQPGFVNWKTKESWISDSAPAGIIATFKLEGRPVNEEGKRFHLFAGLGGSSDKVPFSLRVVSNPAAMFDFVNRAEKLQVRRSEGLVRFEFEGGFLHVDELSGALLEAQFGDEQMKIKLSSGIGLIRQRLKELEQQTADMPNRFEATMPLASYISFVVDGVQQVIRPIADETTPAVQLALKLLQDPETIAAAGDRLSEWLGADQFRIPSASHGRSRHGSQSATVWKLHGLKGLLPVRSGLHRLLSAVLHAHEAGIGEPLENLIAEIRRDDDHDVLTCLVAGLLLKSARPEMARVGLQRLQQDSVPAQIVQLIEEPCVAGHFLKATVSAIRGLDDDEFSLLVQSLRGAANGDVKADLTDGSSIRLNESALMMTVPLQLIRHHTSDDPQQIARELLTLAWQSYGRAKTQQVLESWKTEARPSVIRPASAQTTKPAGKVSKVPVTEDDPLAIPDPDEPIFKRQNFELRR